MIKGVVFDKDGTVLEYEKFWVPVAENAVKLLLAQHSVNEKLLDGMLHGIGAYDGISGVLCYGTYGDITDRLNNALKQSGATVTLSVSETAEAFEQSISCGKLVPTCENITEVFADLKKNNIKIAMVTSDNQTITESCLQELGILAYFDCIYAEDGIHPSKPHPYYMNRFLSEFSLNPGEVLMVGDTMTDIRFAQNSEVKAVAVANKENDRAIVAKEADYVVPDIFYMKEILAKENAEVEA